MASSFLTTITPPPDRSPFPGKVTGASSSGQAQVPLRGVQPTAARKGGRLGQGSRLTLPPTLTPTRYRVWAELSSSKENMGPAQKNKKMAPVASNIIFHLPTTQLLLVRFKWESNFEKNSIMTNGRTRGNRTESIKEQRLI